MRHRNLIELAKNPDFISGIYNYCDRWCERCQFTSRCLVYVTEREDDEVDPASRDINNEAFWRRLATIFQETRESITAWAEEAGIDLSGIDGEAVAQRERQHADAAQNHLAIAAKNYAAAVTKWFGEFDSVINASDISPQESDEQETDQIEEAREVIYWYQFQIAVKIMRALKSESEERDAAEQPSDSDGSAKVALIGIDRSMSAWRLMQLCQPERSDGVIALMLALERLRKNTEQRFPNARDFIRPGFDEVLGEAN